MTSRGRDPRFLRPGFPHQARRAAGPLRDAVVHRPTEPGTYHLFCTQFCGTGHAEMIGEIVAMTGARLSEMAGAERRQRDAGAGRARRCSCATAAAAATAATASAAVKPAARCARRRWPASTAARCRCRTARVVTADDRYIRDCILMPRNADASPAIRRSCRPSPDRSARRIS